MAFNNTTVTSAVVASDRSIIVSSASGFAAGNSLRIDGEFMKVAQSYVSGTTIPVLRGQDGTVTSAHVSGAVITSGLASDFQSPPAGAADSVTNPIYPTLPIYSYGATGAIAPVAGIHKLVGTGTLAMTLANPTKDQDGTVMFVIGDGKSQSTIDFPDATGISGAGSSYDTITFQNAGLCCILLIACNGAWLTPSCPGITGTVTAMTVAVA